MIKVQSLDYAELTVLIGNVCAKNKKEENRCSKCPAESEILVAGQTGTVKDLKCLNSIDLLISILFTHNSNIDIFLVSYSNSVVMRLVTIYS